MLSLPCFETVFLLLTACYDTAPYMRIMLSMLLLFHLLPMLNNDGAYITSACIYVINGHHLPLGSDWLCAAEYGGCTRQKSGEYLYCSLQ